MYSEAESVIAHMVTVFSEKADTLAIRSARHCIDEIAALSAARHEEMRNSLKELSRQVERAQATYTERQAKLENFSEKETLLTEREQIEQNIARIQQETLEIKKQMGAVENRTTEVCAKEQQIRQQESVEVPRARHTISLYANISAIRWDYGSDKIKGFVTSAKGDGMKAFELDPTQHSSYDITNSLWDLMDS
uniref:Kinetochore protein Spc24 n=1 Tax=Chrysotila carterae TaxID=13221 RepID=A0A7S4C342_CHRCT